MALSCDAPHRAVPCGEASRHPTCDRVRNLFGPKLNVAGLSRSPLGHEDRDPCERFCVCAGSPSASEIFYARGSSSPAGMASACDGCCSPGGSLSASDAADPDAGPIEFEASVSGPGEASRVGSDQEHATSGHRSGSVARRGTRSVSASAGSGSGDATPSLASAESNKTVA